MKKYGKKKVVQILDTHMAMIKMINKIHTLIRKEASLMKLTDTEEWLFYSRVINLVFQSHYRLSLEAAEKSHKAKSIEAIKTGKDDK